MTVAELLADLQARGIEVRAVGDKLRWRPPSALTDADRQALIAQKAELLAALSSPVQAPAPMPPASEPPQTDASGYPIQIVERNGHLIRLAGIDGWIEVERLHTPCRGCGGTRWAIGHWRLFCPRCLRPKRGERIRGQLDVSVVGEIRIYSYS